MNGQCIGIWYEPYDFEKDGQRHTGETLCIAVANPVEPNEKQFGVKPVVFRCGNKTEIHIDKMIDLVGQQISVDATYSKRFDKVFVRSVYPLKI